jgi:hypothetical protein
MFSDAFIYLNRSLRLAQSQNPNFHTIRDTLNAAARAVMEDPTQTDALKREASSRIQQAISYTYSRTNPASPFAPMSFQSMASTPISPFQRNTMGPYGFVKGPIVPGQPDLVPKTWTQRGRETQALSLMIQAAINVVRKGLR